MKVLIVGDWSYNVYEQAFFDAFINNGVKAYSFKWNKYLRPFNINKKFQNKFIIGPAILSINNDLIKYSNKLRPDLVFIYRGTHIYPKTIKKLRSMGCIVFAYNNDDPFSTISPIYLFRLFRRGLYYYDWIFAYRKKNIIEYNQSGLRNTSLLRSYYINSLNYPIENIKLSNKL